MRRSSARRVLLGFGTLMAVFIIVGLAFAGRDPIQRTYGQAGRELENAMDRLGMFAIACSREIVASAGAGGASVGCTTSEGVHVGLIAFADVDTRDRWASGNCGSLGGPLITPRASTWVLATYSQQDGVSVRSELQRVGVHLVAPPPCQGITIPFPSPTLS